MKPKSEVGREKGGDIQLQLSCITPTQTWHLSLVPSPPIREHQRKDGCLRRLLSSLPCFFWESEDVGPPVPEKDGPPVPEKDRPPACQSQATTSTRPCDLESPTPVTASHDLAHRIRIARLVVTTLLPRMHFAALMILMEFLLLVIRDFEKRAGSQALCPKFDTREAKSRPQTPVRWTPLTKEELLSSLANDFAMLVCGPRPLQASPKFRPSPTSSSSFLSRPNPKPHPASDTSVDLTPDPLGRTPTTSSGLFFGGAAGRRFSLPYRHGVDSMTEAEVQAETDRGLVKEVFSWLLKHWDEIKDVKTR